MKKNFLFLFKYTIAYDGDLMFIVSLLYFLTVLFLLLFSFPCVNRISQSYYCISLYINLDKATIWLKIFYLNKDLICSSQRLDTKFNLVIRKIQFVKPIKQNLHKNTYILDTLF